MADLDPTATVEALPPGDDPRRIGRYELVSRLGRGAMGAVYRAYDPNIDRMVAVKIMRPWMATRREQAELQQRFLAEVRAAGRLRHPGVVSVYDADRDPETGMAFLAMELVEGCSLGDLLELKPVLRAALAVEIASQVAEALAVAHDELIVHRDIKPENLLIDTSGGVKISDFGIVKIGQEAITATGQTLGTPLYMAPEQLLGEEVGAAADLYALGAVLYRCLTGSPPFEGESLGRLAYRIAHQEPRPPSELNPDISDRVEKAVLRSLAKSPEDRFANGSHFAEELRQAAPPGESRPELIVLVGEAKKLAPKEVELSSVVTTVGPGPERGPQSSQVVTHAERGRRSRRSAWWLGSLALVAILVGVGWMLLVESDRRGEVYPGEVQATRELPRPYPVVEPEEPVPAAAPKAARLRLEFRNRLSRAVLSVRCDGELLWSQELVRRNVFRRMIGTPVAVNLEIPAGAHDFEVSVEGLSMKVDASAALTGELEEGELKILRAALNPYSERLELSWR